jgi:hypothetical protein
VAVLFLEAQAPDHPTQTIEETVKIIEKKGLLRQEEARVLQRLPARSFVVLGWLNAFFENALSDKSDMACAFGWSNGRYSVIANQLIKAREAVNKTNAYLTCQMPFGYVHLILLLVHLTCFCNTLYTGINFGEMLSQLHRQNAGPEEYVPLYIARILRLLLLPLILDGMMLIGSVIANPLGTEADDFPSSRYLEEMEDEGLAVSEGIVAYHPSSTMIKKSTAPEAS